jgi:hypothetical protein
MNNKRESQSFLGAAHGARGNAWARVEINGRLDETPTFGLVLGKRFGA